jgi:hypothetical protein
MIPKSGATTKATTRVNTTPASSASLHGREFHWHELTENEQAQVMLWYKLGLPIEVRGPDERNQWIQLESKNWMPWFWARDWNYRLK